MPRLGSMMLEFILDALNENKYPNLQWFGGSSSKFVLKCMNKRNKNWSSQYCLLFEDWDKKKTRNVACDVDTKRSRFISGLKKSKYFGYCKSESKKHSPSKEQWRVYEILPCGAESPSLDDHVDNVENIHPQSFPTLESVELHNQGNEPLMLKIENQQDCNTAQVCEPLGEISAFEGLLDIDCSSQDLKDSLEDFVPYLNDPSLNALDNDFDRSCTLNDTTNHLEKDLKSSNFPIDFQTGINDLFDEMDFPMEDPITPPYSPENEMVALQSPTSQRLSDVSLSFTQESAEVEALSPGSSVGNDYLDVGQYQNPTLLINAVCVGITKVGEQRYQVLLQPMG